MAHAVHNWRLQPYGMRSIGVTKPSPHNDPRRQHPGSLLVHPFRYVDNLVGIKHQPTPIHTVLQNFQRIYGLQLREEVAGPELKAPLSQLQITMNPDGSPHVQMRMARQYDPNLPIEQQKYRFPEPFTPRAKQTVHSIIPAMAIGTMYYRETHLDLLC